jgi:hypothetical protein
VACIKVVELVLELASPSYLLTCGLVKLVENLNRLFTPSSHLDLKGGDAAEVASDSDDSAIPIEHQMYVS